MPKEELVVEVAPAVPAQGDKPAKGPVYRNVLAKDGYCKTPGVSNLYEVFCRSVKRYRDKEFLGWRPKSEGQAAPFKWLTFAEVSERVDQAAGGFAKSGLTQNGRCAIFSANSPEWMITMQVHFKLHQLLEATLLRAVATLACQYHFIMLPFCIILPCPDHACTTAI